MPRYRVYGSLLDSEIEFPGLPAVTAPESDAAHWRMRRHETLPPMRDAAALGAETLYQDVQARLFSHAEGWRIVVDDTGAFDLRDDGEILAAPRPDAWDDFVRSHLLGRVLSAALYRDGWLSLHASAVSTREGVIGFLGPKGVGKSSLASALVAAGAPLVTDDTLPVQPGTPPMAWPGIHLLRLRPDTREAVALDGPGTETREGKQEIALRDERLREESPRPLAALFFLSPSPEHDRAAAARRTPFSPALAAAALVGHVKGGQMLGSTAAAPLLARLAALVHLVPVSQLSLVRDLARLPDAVASILEWYGGAAPR